MLDIAQPAARPDLAERAGGGRGRRSFLWRVGGPLVLYSALALLLTWPLVAQIATHVPGDGIDDPALAWNLWWVKHALVDAPQNPFLVAWQFWPIGINLAFYTLTLLNGMLAIPLQVAFGIIPAYNLILLSSFVIGGFGAYLLCLDFLACAPDKAHGRAGATPPDLLYAAVAGLGGAFYAFASAKLFYAALGQGNIASSQWIPFAVLYIVRAARLQGRPRDAVLAALFITLQAYAELTYASFLGIFAACAVLWRGLGGRFWRPAPDRRIFRQAALRLALFVVLFAIGIAPILVNMLPDLAAEGDFFTSGGGFADIFSADLAGYALPTQLHPVFGDLTRRLTNNSVPRPDGSHFPVNKGQHIYLGYTVLVLAAVGMWSGRRRSQPKFWALSAGLFFLLTLGPDLRVAGYDQPIPLPFTLVARLPFFKGNRYPSRYSVMLLVSLAPLAALGAWRITDGLRRRASQAARHLAFWTPALLIGLLLFEHLSLPLPLSDLRVPALYERVAAAPGDFALLELPPGWRNGARVAGKQDVVIMQELWNQTSHGKRVLGGNTSRNPEAKFQAFSEDPTLARLIASTNAADVPQHDALRSFLADNPVTAAEAARARSWAATWNIRYVMVHRDSLPPTTEQTLQELLPISLVAEEGALALYQIMGDTQPPAYFAVGADAGRMVLAEGWSPPGLGEPVYAQRQEVRLLLPLAAGAQQVRFDMWAAAAGQMVTLVVDGRQVATAAVSPQRAPVTFDLPADPARPHLSDVRLRFSMLVPVARSAAGAVPIGQTGVAVPVSVVVRSGGQETGDFAHIYVDGVDVSPNRRGYNLVALDPADGRVLAAAAFDTHADAAASRQLAGWVRGLPAGAIVAGAVRDEASLNLSQDAVEALAGLGARVDLRQHFRWGHAFIGVVGAAGGTAAEVADGSRVAQIAAGTPATAPQVAGALAGVQIVK